MENYPTGNKELISSLKLEVHAEGGYFVETDRQEDLVPSPFANDQKRSLATSIYYFLTPERPTGFFHMNKSITYHVLHQGRAEYTLIHPPAPLPLSPPLSRTNSRSEDVKPQAPRIEKIVMGTDGSAGEVRMLLVGTGVWKKSRLLPEDLQRAKASPGAEDRTGCLITEVVVPGFAWEDHKYMTENDLNELFSGVKGGEDYVQRFRENLRTEI